MLAYIVYQDDMVIIPPTSYQSMSEGQLIWDIQGHDASGTHRCHSSMSYHCIDLTPGPPRCSSGLVNVLREADQDP